MTFDALPFWVRRTTCAWTSRTPACACAASAGLENLERTFWRGDDAEAGDGDAEDAEDARGTPPKNSGGELVRTNASSVGDDQKKNGRKKHEPFMLPATASWSSRGTRRERRTARATRSPTTCRSSSIGKRDPTAQESQFKKGIVQDNRQDKRVWNPDQSLARGCSGGPGRFLPRGRPHRPGVFRNPARRRVRRSPGPGDGEGRSRGGARTGGAVPERARAGASGRDGRGGGRGRPRGTSPGTASWCDGRARTSASNEIRVASLGKQTFFVFLSARSVGRVFFQFAGCSRRFRHLFACRHEASSRLRRALRSSFRWAACSRAASAARSRTSTRPPRSGRSNARRSGSAPSSAPTGRRSTS